MTTKVKYISEISLQSKTWNNNRKFLFINFLSDALSSAHFASYRRKYRGLQQWEGIYSAYFHRKYFTQAVEYTVTKFYSNV